MIYSCKLPQVRIEGGVQQAHGGNPRPVVIATRHAERRRHGNRHAIQRRDEQGCQEEPEEEGGEEAEAGEERNGGY